MRSRAALQLYRTFLRHAQRMQRADIELHLRKPVSDAWGSHQYSETGLAYAASALGSLLPRSSLRTFPGSDVLEASDLRRLVRQNFKANVSAPAPEATKLLGEAVSALRVLLEQLYMQRCSSTCDTDGVRVEATSKFSSAGTGVSGRSQNLFSYRIRVTNMRDEPIQVLGREWSIKNDKGIEVVHVPHVPGNAVVGQQPVIPPGDCFEYCSGTDLDTPAGLQTGKLEVAVLSNGRPIRTVMAVVAPFAHLRPDMQRS